MKRMRYFEVPSVFTRTVSEVEVAYHVVQHHAGGGVEVPALQGCQSASASSRAERTITQPRPGPAAGGFPGCLKWWASSTAMP